MSADTHTQSHAHGDTGNIRLAFCLNLGFTLFEFTGSVAILVDAVHDLGDSVALGFSWWMEHFSRRGASQHYSYGHERFTLLGALVNAGVLVGGSLFVLSEAIPQLWNPTEPYAAGMLVIAIIGVLVNGVAVLRLRGSRGLNAEVMGWHLLEDVSGWLAVLLVSIILLFTDWYILDPLLSILITLWVGYNAACNLTNTLRILLQAVPPEVDLEQVDRQLQALPGVRSTHHTHIWSLDGQRNVLTTHMVVGAKSSKAEIVRTRAQAQQMLEECAMVDGKAEVS
jgi:cobalt-zinc-cadmium efflux system protein